MGEITIAEARRGARSKLKQLRLEQVIATVVMPSYNEWIGRVETAIAIAGTKLAAKRNYLPQSEDGLTSALLLFLDGLGFEADMKMINGNCDVVVQEEDYLWLGEAKLDNGPAWLWKGFQQLLTRYATGLPQQDHGGMIIYCVSDSLPATMAGWRAALKTEQGLADDAIQDSAEADHAFRTTAPVPATNRPLHVLHLGIALFHSPQDPTAQLSPEASLAARHAKQQVKK
jgi:hypothetical protein